MLVGGSWLERLLILSPSTSAPGCVLDVFGAPAGTGDGAYAGAVAFCVAAAVLVEVINNVVYFSLGIIAMAMLYVVTGVLTVIQLLAKAVLSSLQSLVLIVVRDVFRQ